MKVYDLDEMMESSGYKKCLCDKARSREEIAKYDVNDGGKSGLSSRESLYTPRNYGDPYMQSYMKEED